MLQRGSHVGKTTMWGLMQRLMSLATKGELARLLSECSMYIVLLKR